VTEPTDEINLDSVQSVGSLDLTSENSRRRTCDVYPLILFVIANTPIVLVQIQTQLLLVALMPQQQTDAM
jgi:hypothetical protein